MVVVLFVFRDNGVWYEVVLTGCRRRRKLFFYFETFCTADKTATHGCFRTFFTTRRSKTLRVQKYFLQKHFQVFRSNVFSKKLSGKTFPCIQLYQTFEQNNVKLFTYTRLNKRVKYVLNVFKLIWNIVIQNRFFLNLEKHQVCIMV